MTNRDKFLDEILAEDCCSVVALLRTGIQYCAAGEKCSECRQNNLKWLQEEYAETEIDWTKVQVDTLIEVSLDKDFDKSFKRYFAKYEDERIWTWKYGATSKTSVDGMTPWKYARLVEE